MFYTKYSTHLSQNSILHLCWNSNVPDIDEDYTLDQIAIQHIFTITKATNLLSASSEKKNSYAKTNISNS